MRRIISLGEGEARQGLPFTLPAGGEGDDHSRNLEDSNDPEVQNLKGGPFSADQVPECIPRCFCSAPKLLVQPASLGTPHVSLALEDQLNDGTAAIARERFEIQPDKRGSATAEFSGQYPVREKELREPRCCLGPNSYRGLVSVDDLVNPAGHPHRMGIMETATPP